MHTVQQSIAISDASREFKRGVNAMRITIRDFNQLPSEEAVRLFDVMHGLALHSLNVIASSADDRFTGTIRGLQHEVMQLRENFNALVAEQKVLGFDENSGLQTELRNSGNAVERIINDNMGRLAAGDGPRLMGRPTPDAASGS